MKLIKYIIVLALASAYTLSAQENRTYDGLGNNIANPEWGAAGSYFRTLITVDYSDGISEPGGENRANPRTVSNAIGSQESFVPNELGLSDFVWGWGQLIDHDINLNDDNVNEPYYIPVPGCDPMFDPACLGDKEIRMFRSLSDVATGTDISNPRRHVNEITSFIDGSLVYGSDIDRANWLRSGIDGLLKVGANQLLPWNTIDGQYESAVDTEAPHMAIDGTILPDKYFVGGDVRVNEQPGLSCFHTLMVLEHNRQAAILKDENPDWNDEQLFQRARKIVSGLIQAVTYEEFLPAMGVILPTYSGYDVNMDASIANVFSGAAFRFGHTMVNGRLIRYEENGDEFQFGAIDLRDGYFNPELLKDEGGISPFFRGMAAQEHQYVDPLIMNDLRNFLFGPPGSGGIDLLAVNINRARERGVSDLNTIRVELGLSPHTTFADITSDIELQNKLATVYSDINDIDPLIGLLSEDHLPNTIFGEGLLTIMMYQFGALRDGDRYYYENDTALSQTEIDEIKNTKLSEIILRNTDIETLQEDVFTAVPRDELAIEFFPFSGVMNIDVTAYPNPVQKYFKLRIEARRSSMATLRIFDLNGIQVQEKQIPMMRGVTEHEFELSDQLANGTYVISLESDAGKGSLKIIKGK